MTCHWSITIECDRCHATYTPEGAAFIRLARRWKTNRTWADWCPTCSARPL